MNNLPTLIAAAQVVIELCKQSTRSNKRVPLKRARVDEELKQDDSQWARMLQTLADNSDLRSLRKFRRRFRVPYELFQLIYKITKDSGVFEDKDKEILKTGRRSARLDLLLLGALKCMGCGYTFDNIQELSGISAETIRVFFHKWTEWFVNNNRKKYIRDGSCTDHDLNIIMSTFAAVHLPGCCGSIDNVHVYWQGCPSSLRNQYERGSDGPSVSYLVASDHSRRIIDVSDGFPGSTNDKTIVRYDDYVKLIKDRTDFVYSYRDRNGYLQSSNSLWLLSDGGYHYWSCLQFPYKHPSDREEQVFSLHLAKVRKDIECIFGILRIKWRILRAPMLYHQKKRVHNVFLTICILHNMLLDLSDNIYHNYDDDEDEDNVLMPTRTRRQRKENRRYMDDEDRSRLAVDIDVEHDDTHQDVRAIVRDHYLWMTAGSGETGR